MHPWLPAPQMNEKKYRMTLRQHRSSRIELARKVRWGVVRRAALRCAVCAGGSSVWVGGQAQLAMRTAAL